MDEKLVGKHTINTREKYIEKLVSFAYYQSTVSSHDKDFETFNQNFNFPFEVYEVPWVSRLSFI